MNGQIKRIDELGRIVIPKDIRKRLSIKTNDTLEIGMDGDKIVLNKRIAIIGKNSYKWCVSYLAASIVGIVVPIDKELHTDDVINFMNVSQAVCILGDNKNLENVLNETTNNIINYTKEDTFLRNNGYSNDKLEEKLEGLHSSLLS